MGGQGQMDDDQTFNVYFFIIIFDVEKPVFTVDEKTEGDKYDRRSKLF